VLIRTVLHSSFGWQQFGPQARSSCLQHVLESGFPQNSPWRQQLMPHGLKHGQLTSPGLPHRVPGGHVPAPDGFPVLSLKQQQK
jgi:hypothetical protein